MPGLIGLNLLSMGLFAVGMVTVAYREKGKFRRLAVTPLPKWVFLLGQILQRVTVGAAADDAAAARRAGSASTSRTRARISSSPRW